MLLTIWLLVAVFFSGRHAGEQSMVRRHRNAEARIQLEKTKVKRAEEAARRKVQAANAEAQAAIASEQIYEKLYEDLALRFWKLEREYAKLKSLLNQDNLDLPRFSLTLSADSCERSSVQFEPRIRQQGKNHGQRFKNGTT